MWIDGELMFAAGRLLALDEEFDLRQRLPPECFLYVCLMWPYLLWQALTDAD